MQGAEPRQRQRQRQRHARDLTILMDASVRLMNLGRTSPSSPAASSSAASHSESTVPTSWAKHSVQVRSALARPSTRPKLEHEPRRGNGSEKVQTVVTGAGQQGSRAAGRDVRVFWSSSFRK